MTNPAKPPPKKSTRNSLTTKPIAQLVSLERTPKSTEYKAIAAASLSRLSPSTSVVNLLGAPTSLKIPITAAGSVVDTIAPSNRHATIPMPENSDNTTPTNRVLTTTATIAIIRIGPMSSMSLLTFMDSAVSNNKMGKKTIRKVSEEISKVLIMPRKSPITGGAHLKTCAA